MPFYVDHFFCSALKGMTALHFAADRGFSEVADALLQSGANVNAVDSTGQTALMYAVSCENKVRGLFPLEHCIAKGLIGLF